MMPRPDIANRPPFCSCSKSHRWAKLLCRPWLALAWGYSSCRGRCWRRGAQRSHCSPSAGHGTLTKHANTDDRAFQRCLDAGGYAFTAFRGAANLRACAAGERPRASGSRHACSSCASNAKWAKVSSGQTFGVTCNSEQLSKLQRLLALVAGDDDPQPVAVCGPEQQQRPAARADRVDERRIPRAVAAPAQVARKEGRRRRH